MKSIKIHWIESGKSFSAQTQLYTVLSEEKIDEKHCLLFTDGDQLSGGVLAGNEIFLQLSGREKALLMQKMMQEIEEADGLEEALFHIK